MKIKTLQDSELLIKTKALVSKEKEITLEILSLLREIESRKLYLARGFSSLFEFCVKELGYSEGSANRRISSMRLLRQLPEIEVKIKENKVNLSTLTQLHCHIRREEKFKKTKISKVEKLELLTHIEGKSQSTCQRELLKFSSQPQMAVESERVLVNDLTLIRFAASDELMKKFRQLKNLMAHKNHNPSWAEFFELLTEMSLNKLDPRRKGTDSIIGLKKVKPKNKESSYTLGLGKLDSEDKEIHSILDLENLDHQNKEIHSTLGLGNLDPEGKEIHSALGLGNLDLKSRELTPALNLKKPDSRNIKEMANAPTATA